MYNLRKSKKATFFKTSIKTDDLKNVKRNGDHVKILRICAQNPKTSKVTF